MDRRCSGIDHGMDVDDELCWPVSTEPWEREKPKSCR